MRLGGHLVHQTHLISPEKSKSVRAGRPSQISQKEKDRVIREAGETGVRQSSHRMYHFPTFAAAIYHHITGGEDRKAQKVGGFA